MRKRISEMIRRKEHRYEDIHRELLLENRLTKSLFFIVSIIFSMGINLVLLHLYYIGTLSGYVHVNLLNLLILLVLLGSIIYFPYHPQHYGFNCNSLSQNLKYGLGIGVVLTGVVILYRYNLYLSGQTDFGLYWDSFIFFRRLSVYIFSVFIQEALTRGYIQSYLIAMFEGIRFHKHISIILSSLIFSLFHTIYGLPVVLGIFLFSCVMGWIYEKLDRSLVGVYIIHFMAGSGLIMFSNVH